MEPPRNHLYIPVMDVMIDTLWHTLIVYLHLPSDNTLCLVVGHGSPYPAIGTEDLVIHIRTFIIIMMVNVDPKQIRISNLVITDVLLSIPIL